MNNQLKIGSKQYDFNMKTSINTCNFEFTKLTEKYSKSQEFYNFIVQHGIEKFSEYLNEQREFIRKSLNLKNIFQVPTISKVTVSMGCNYKKGGSSLIKYYKQLLFDITGQQPVETQAKRSIAQFKIREGATNGLKVTLRKKVMHNFLVKLVFGLLNLNDLNGYSINAINYNKSSCQLNIGIKNLLCFFEIPHKDVNNGCTISIVSKFKTSTPLDKVLFAYILWSIGIPIIEIINNEISFKMEEQK